MSIPLPDTAPARRAINFRSVLLGLIGVVYLSAATFYNNNIVNNTGFLGSVLPIGLLLFFLVLILLVNAPLHRWMPRWAFSGAELAVMLAMMLVACAVPSSQITYLLGHLVGPWNLGVGNASYRQAFELMDLPDWLFPTFAEKDPMARAQDPIVQYYLGRTPREGDAWITRLRAVPWEAWVRPIAAWGLFYAAFFGALVCLGAIVRKQWIENERLPFPLASVYASLLESPEPGHGFNRLFRSRVFWVAVVTVFCIHGINALAVYAPRYWPTIPLRYDMTDIFTQPPWLYMERRIHGTRIFFSVIGITYFVQGRIAFSIWVFILLWQIPRMAFGMIGQEWSHVESADQSVGATTVYAMFILYLGRKHWMTVLRRMFGLARPRDPQDPYLPYGPAGWGLLASLAGMCIWMRVAGANWIGTLSVLAMFFVLFLVLMRIVGETGLFMISFWTVPHRPWTGLLRLFPDWAQGVTSLRTTFHTSTVGTLLAVAQRENVGVYTLHALRVMDLQTEEQPAHRRPGWGLILAMIVALGLAYVVSAGSMLYFEYNYAATLDSDSVAPVNDWVMNVSAPVGIGQAAYQAQHGSPPPQAYSSARYFALGATITLVLSVASVYFTWWPLHPLGYVLVNAFTTYHGWLSIFLGWLAKATVLRFGGVGLFRAARPLFLGMLIGECAAAGFWLCVALVRLWMGLEYHAVRLLP